MRSKTKRMLKTAEEDLQRRWKINCRCKKWKWVNSNITTKTIERDNLSCQNCGKSFHCEARFYLCAHFILPIFKLAVISPVVTVTTAVWFGWIWIFGLIWSGECEHSSNQWTTHNVWSSLLLSLAHKHTHTHKQSHFLFSVAAVRRIADKIRVHQPIRPFVGATSNERERTKWTN